MAQDLQAVVFPAGQGGLNRMQNFVNIPDTDLTWTESLTVENITWQKMPGATKFNSAPVAGGINALWDFWSKDFTQEQVVFLADGRLITLDSTGAVLKTLASLTPATTGWFAEGWLDVATKALFFFNGVDLPQVYANTGAIVATSAPVNTPSPDWPIAGNTPTYGFQHRFRMIVVGGPSSHRAYFSSTQSHDKFGAAQIQGATELEVYPGEGQKLVGGISHRDKVYLFKYPRGIYFVDDADTNIKNWQCLKVTDAIGLPGPGCACGTENDIIIVDSEGYFHAMSQIQYFNQTNIPPLFSRETSDFIRTNINLNALQNTRSLYYGRKRMLIFAMPGVGSSVNNRYLIIDFNMGTGPRLLWSSRDECIALTQRRNVQVQEPIIGDSTGQIWRLDQAARDKGGAGYNAQFEHAAKPLLEAGIRRMDLYELEVLFHPVGNYDLTIEAHKMTKDGVSIETIPFSMQTFGAPVGSISLDPEVLAGTTIQTGRKRLHGDANYLKLIGRNNVASQNFSVMQMIVRGKPGRYA